RRAGAKACSRKAGRTPSRARDSVDRGLVGRSAELARDGGRGSDESIPLPAALPRHNRPHTACVCGGATHGARAAHADRIPRNVARRGGGARLFRSRAFSARVPPAIQRPPAKLAARADVDFPFAGSASAPASAWGTAEG